MNPRAISLLVAGGTLVLSGVPATAWGAPSTAPASSSAPSDRLCRDDDIQCSVQVPGLWLDGSTHQVGITGRPRTKVRLHAYRIDAGPTARWKPLGAALTITTDAKGWGSADLTLPRLGAGEPGGPVLVALPGSVGEPLGRVLGAWTELTGPTPELVGDGFAQSKPVGRPLNLVLDHVVPGTRYAVERKENGAWVPVPAADGAAAPDAQHLCRTSRCTLTYVVPRGLSATSHTFRLVDRDTSLPRATWQVEPHPRGVAKPRTPDPAYAPLSTQIDGSLAASLGADVGAVVRPRSRNIDLPEARGHAASGETAGHPATWVKVLAALGGVAALTIALLPGGLLRPRRTR